MTDDTPLSAEEELDLVASFYEAVNVLDAITCSEFQAIPRKDHADYAVGFAHAIIGELNCSKEIKEQFIGPAEGYMLAVYDILRDEITKGSSDIIFNATLYFNKNSVAIKMHEFAVNKGILSHDTLDPFLSFRH